MESVLDEFVVDHFVPDLLIEILTSTPGDDFDPYSEEEREVKLAYHNMVEEIISGKSHFHEVWLLRLLYWLDFSLPYDDKFWWK